MAHIVGYENQEWGEPIDGERLSTNGNYTGQRLGTPTQDALDVAGQNLDAYYVEQTTIRLGTMTQDAIEGSTPDVATKPTISTGSLAAGTQNSEYDKDMEATGTEPIYWRITKGELPKGLTLAPNTGKISGTPTAVENKTFTVTAINSAGEDSKELSINVSAGV